MEKLLVAIDGSAPSERAADHAIRLSAKYGMPVHFVTVFPEPLVYGEVEIYMTKDKAKKIQTDRGLEFLRPPLERARAAGATRYVEEAAVSVFSPPLSRPARRMAAPPSSSARAAWARLAIC